MCSDAGCMELLKNVTYAVIYQYDDALTWRLQSQYDGGCRANIIEEHTGIWEQGGASM